ncbi:hypothetical protein [Streptosporangium canum]|uniref:hypothetical protein n=1 Tax=Streptosporangium canum TaxID=324952 RepID=UPI0015A51AA5|nr:hypothetical protein [Streptosporangium canum]
MIDNGADVACGRRIRDGIASSRMKFPPFHQAQLPDHHYYTHGSVIARLSRSASSPAHMWQALAIMNFNMAHDLRLRLDWMVARGRKTGSVLDEHWGCTDNVGAEAVGPDWP